MTVSPTGSGIIIASADDEKHHGALHLELFSLNGHPLTRVRLGHSALSGLICSSDGELVVSSEGETLVVRSLHDLRELHRYTMREQVLTFSLGTKDQHAFATTVDGGLYILANPLVNLQVLERLAVELLNL